MVNQLESGQIDGYCVGEPWNAHAVQKGIGHTLITKYEIWNNSPEKVLGLTEEWAMQHPNTHHALLLALLVLFNQLPFDKLVQNARDKGLIRNALSQGATLECSQIP